MKSNFSKSDLSHKISLCRLIQQLDENACVNVMRSIHQDLRCDSLNQLLIKIIMNFTQHTTCFVNIEKTIKDELESTRNNKNDDKRLHKTEGKKEENSTLLRLPIDLISKTALFFNEDDIFNVELCCRLFYQMINNLSYLKQSNNFKTLHLTPLRLDQVLDPECNFYKYCLPETLIAQYNDISTECELEEFINQFEEKLKKAQAVIRCDEWIVNVLKSIKSIQFETDTSPLLHTLPLDILFNSDESQLEMIELDCYWNTYGKKTWNKCMNQFEKQYLDLETRFKKEKKKMHVLNCIRYDNPHLDIEEGVLSHQFGCIKSRHLCLSGVVMDLSSWNFNNNPCLSMITIECDCIFENIERMNNNPRGKVKTLRLIDLTNFSNVDCIFKNQRLIESLNFHNSVKNLTIQMTFDDTKHWQRWCKENVISNLLTKKHYFNLVNFNILLEFLFCTHDPKDIDTDWIFHVLKQNLQILKHQFHHLNIGLLSSKIKAQQCDVIEWNPDIDDKLLEAKQKEWNKWSQSSSQFETNVEKYLELKNQWQVDLIEYS